MNRSLGSYIVLGNIPASLASAKRIDYNGALKFLHTGFLVGASGFITFLINNVTGINLYPDSTTDEMLITMFLIPILKLAVTWIPNHSS